MDHNSGCDMRYMDAPGPATQCTILCCQCGVGITPNPANLCIQCIRGEVDISEGIQKQTTVHFCKRCERYLQPPANWVLCALESRELLALCLKKLKGLNQVRLVDAGFIWTEPHSKRLKVKLTIQKEVLGSTILQQVFIVEYTVANQMCPTCHRDEAKDHWNSVVQVRQKVDHKRTFYYLEQLIIKHNAARQSINIKERPDGLDFYFATKSEAVHMVDFLNNVVPVRSKTSERLISSDIQNAVFNYKFTFSVEIVPVCKDDLVCLPRKLARSLGNIPPVLLCIRVGNSLHLMDVNTLQICDVSNSVYWRDPFMSICSHRSLVEYTILDVELLGISRGKFELADMQVARTRDLGVNDTTFLCRSHLGSILQAGDTCLGFDVRNSNINDAHANLLSDDAIPDVVLVKKNYPGRSKKRSRAWKVKQMNKELDGMGKKEEEKAAVDFEKFMQEIEEDKDLRSNINIYRDPNALPTTMAPESVADPSELPEPIALEEMLDGLNINDGDNDHLETDNVGTDMDMEMN